MHPDQHAQRRRPRRPQTAVVTAGRTSGRGQPLDVPPVLASRCHGAPGPTPSATVGRAYAGDDGSPDSHALVGELMSGAAVTSCSGMAANHTCTQAGGRS